MEKKSERGKKKRTKGPNLAYGSHLMYGRKSPEVEILSFFVES